MHPHLTHVEASTRIDYHLTTVQDEWEKDRQGMPALTGPLFYEAVFELLGERGRALQMFMAVMLARGAPTVTPTVVPNHPLARMCSRPSFATQTNGPAPWTSGTTSPCPLPSTAGW